jgi:hypothetical protein
MTSQRSRLRELLRVWRNVFLLTVVVLACILICSNFAVRQRVRATAEHAQPLWMSEKNTEVHEQLAGRPHRLKESG